jgi:hypothetical protein
VTDVGGVDPVQELILEFDREASSVDVVDVDRDPGLV